ncbi:hypothetical protein D3C80_873090 [compost metagenome]
MTDDEARKSLEPVIQALKASIPMQKAIENHLQTLEKLRGYGYSNGFISEALSKDQDKPITAQLFASMMYRARKKKPAQTKAAAQVKTTDQPAANQSSIPTNPKPEADPRRPRRFVHNPTPPANILD